MRAFFVLAALLAFALAAQPQMSVAKTGGGKQRATGPESSLEKQQKRVIKPSDRSAVNAVGNWTVLTVYPSEGRALALAGP